MAHWIGIVVSARSQIPFMGLKVRFFKRPSKPEAPLPAIRKEAAIVRVGVADRAILAL